MVDVPNKVEIAVESESTDNLDKTLNTTDNTTDNIKQNSTQEVSTSTLDNVDAIDVVSQEESSTDENNSSEVVNCLALTVKKDYSLSIVKNVVVRTLKNIWRVAVSIFTLNLLKFFM